MGRPANIPLPDIVRGDTWDGITASLSTDGTLLADSLVGVRMSFKGPDSDAEALMLTSAAGQIVITSAANWRFTVNPITPFPLTVGTFSWNIETTDSGGSIKTYLAGTILVIND